MAQQGGGFFGFSTEMPELRPEELALLEQNMGTESDRLNLETFGDLGEELGGELDSDLDKLNEDTFGDLDGLEQYQPLQPTRPTTDDAESLAEGLEHVSLGVAGALLKDEWDTPMALLAPSDLGLGPGPAPLTMEELEARLRAQAKQPPPPMGAPMPPMRAYASDYNNLMTRSDKDFIIRVQMAQLQPANPHVDDFYYQAYTLKQERLRTGDEAGNVKMYVARHTTQKENVYVPVSFENTLGKIASQNVATPRPLIDFAGRREVAGAGLSRRRVLKTIEAGYMVAIAIEDLDSEMLAVPNDARQPLQARRNAHVDQVCGLLQLPGSEGLMRLLQVPKAQRLVARLAPLLGADTTQKLAEWVMQNLNTLDEAEAIASTLAPGLARAVADPSAALVPLMAMGPTEARAVLVTKLGQELVAGLIARARDNAVHVANKLARDLQGHVGTPVSEHGWHLLLALATHATAGDRQALLDDLRPRVEAHSLDAVPEVAGLRKLLVA